MSGVVVSLAACLLVSGDARCETAGSSRKNNAAPGGAAVPSLAELRNATFAGIDTSPITLYRGVYEGPPFVPGGASRQRVVLLDGQPATGDLNGDGVNEAVVFLSENTGGSSSALYMAVVGRPKGKLVNISTVRLGDRVSVRSVQIEKGRVSLDLLQHGPKDAACCPSELVSRAWSLERSGLVEQAIKKRPGTLNLTAISGVEWIFRGFAPDPETPVESGATLVFDKERARGFTGCNGYVGRAATTSVPGEMTLKVSKTTNKYCGNQFMSDEENFITALRTTTWYGYYLGDLVLTYRKPDGNQGILRFAPRKLPAR